MSNSEKRNGAGKRVVVTGMSVVSAAGLTLESLWDACQNGRSAVSVPDGGTSSYPLRYVAPVSAFTGDIANFGPLPDPLKKAIRKGLKLMSREIQLGVASAQRALNDAGWNPELYAPERVGVSYASDYIITTPEEVEMAVKSCMTDGQFDFARWADEGLPRMTPVWQLKFLPNMPASHMCIYNQFRGPCNAITNREASIGAAVGEASEIIRAGKADVMLVGATGSRLLPFKMIHALSQGDVSTSDLDPKEISRPFDPKRSGMVLGEGAGALILEDAEQAEKRGARICAEIVGGTCRTLHMPRTPSGHVLGDIEGSLTLSLKALFDRFDIAHENIGSINSGSFSTVADDAAEARVINRFFGDKTPVTNIKGHLGNPGAGGGAIELIAGIMALQKRALYPILNNTARDPACPINPVREYGLDPGHSFVKLAYERFGQSSALFVREYQGAR